MTREIKFRIWSNNYNKYIESYANTHEETFGEGRYGYEGYHLALRPNGKLYDADVGIDYPGTLSEIPTLDWEDESENNEVEQCTGLKDKNGKEIYEGDILKVRLPEEGPKNQNFVGYGCGGWKEDQHPGEHNYKCAEIIVEYDTDDAMFKTYDHQKKTEPLAFLNLTACEIVGNIHENPELLK